MTSENKALINAVARSPTFWVALVILMASGWFIWYLIGNIDADETTWNRLSVIFNLVQTIAVGAAGALFGSSFQRERARLAEKRAEMAEAKLLSLFKTSAS